MVSRQAHNLEIAGSIPASATNSFFYSFLYPFPLSYMDEEQTAAQPEQPEQAAEQRELTFGEKAVGLTFNPSGNPEVQALKEAYAKVIDLCNNMRNEAVGEKIRLLSVAITEAQGSQMFAVKAATWEM